MDWIEGRGKEEENSERKYRGGDDEFDEAISFFQILIDDLDASRVIQHDLLFI